MVPPSTGKSSSEMESTSVCVAERTWGDGDLEVTKVERENMKNSTAEPEEIILDLGEWWDTIDCHGEISNIRYLTSLIYSQLRRPPFLPMQISGWPSLPPFGYDFNGLPFRRCFSNAVHCGNVRLYVGQVSPPPVIPVDGVSNSTKTLQSTHPSQIRPKRCATHFYIAQNILYHKQITRISPFWPSAAGAAPLYASKQFNLNSVPPSDSAILGGPLRGSVPGRNLSSIQEKTAQFPQDILIFPLRIRLMGSFLLEMGHRENNPYCSSCLRLDRLATCLLLRSFFPESATVMANKPGAAKVIAGSGNTTQSSTATSSPAVGTSVAPGTTMSFNYLVCLQVSSISSFSSEQWLPFQYSC
ncbi:hypothetical protein HPP92_005837 [Vanilla planifolia]|uniref:Uncharacterized protein n=1 Tax=Vanilla planifolia TaxID=51239 RepID=A0A835VF38_VANPL|nr:hypothetical protein HPP92_005837 [Vanilla planifolia]